MASLKNTGVYNSEYIISGLPYINSGRLSTSQSFSFQNNNGVDYETQWVTVTNTGTSGSVFVAFEPSGFRTNNCLILSASDTITQHISVNKIYLSGVAEQPFILEAGLTTVNDNQTFFEPTDISNLYAWWRSDTNLTSSTTITWTDRTSNRLILRSAIASETPTISSSNPRMGNKPSLNFDGSNDYLSCSNQSSSAFNFMHDGTGGTMFCTFLPLRTTANTVMSNLLTTTVSGGFNIRAETGLVSTLVYRPGTLIVNTPVPAAYTTPINLPINYCVSFASSSLPQFNTHLYNGRVTSGSATGVPDTSGVAPGTKLMIGARGPDGAATNGRMELTEIIFYNKELSESEKQNVITYLNKRYNTPY